MRDRSAVLLGPRQRGGDVLHPDDEKHFVLDALTWAYRGGWSCLDTGVHDGVAGKATLRGDGPAEQIVGSVTGSIAGPAPERRR
jgi:hypothetical protein